MSGFPYNKPSGNSLVYSEIDYNDSSELTISQLSNIFVGLSDSRLSAISGITSGTAIANKALILDSSSSISGINSLSTSSISNNGNLLTGDIAGSNGLFRFVNSSSVCYIQTGTGLSSGSSADLFIGNISQAYNASSRRFMIKSTGNVGIGTYLPNKTLSVNGSMRMCAASDGSETSFVDLQYVSGTGMKLTITDTLNQALLIQQSGATSNLAIATGLDLGTAYQTRALAITATSGGLSGSEFYGFGTTNSQYLDSYNGFRFYTSTTTSSLGNVKATLSSLGALTISSNLKIGDTCWIGCTSSPNIMNMASSGVCLIGTSTVSNSSNWLEVAAGGGGTYSAYFAGRVGIGASSPSYPLDVRGYVTNTSLNSFGYLASTGASTATGYTNRKFSIQSEWGILVVSGEINVMSDERVKKDIARVDDDLVDRFMDIKPI